MASERVVRREVETVTPAGGGSGTAERVTRTTESAEVVEQREQAPVVVQPVVQPVAVPEKPAVTNVNVNADPASGNVNINTPDGTQVNVNT